MTERTLTSIRTRALDSARVADLVGKPLKLGAIEKDVKARVRRIIEGLAPTAAHLFMPVQAGFGSPDLDFVVSVNGFALRVETKVNGKRPSPRQALTIKALDGAGVPVLLIDQNNLIDVAVVVDLLLTGKQGEAHRFAQDQREAYTER